MENEITKSAQAGYKGYQALVRNTLQSISDLSMICNKLGIEKSKQTLECAAEKLQSKEFTVGILGEFNRGKSTVINALLGQEIVPADIIPCSATLNYIRWDASPSAVVNYKDGRKETVEVDTIKDYVTKLTDESSRKAETVENVVVNYPCKFCKNGVQIVDTPGLNDEDRMTAITESVIPYLDAMILVVVHTSPFGLSEAEFVRNKVMTSDLGRMLVVVNRIDEIRKESDRVRIIEEVKKKFMSSVLDKIAETYGQDSQEMRDAKSKVGELKVIGVSALDALIGKQDNDDELLGKSNFGTLEKELSWILNEERGSIELISPVNTVLSTAKEVNSTIEMRLSALNMDQEKLEQITQQGIDEAKRSREIAEEEIRKLGEGSKNLYQELLPEVETIYKNIKDGLLHYVSEVDINPADISDNNGMKKKSEEIMKVVNEELKQKLSAGAELLTVKIQQKVNNDISDFSDNAKKIFSGLIKVQHDFNVTGKSSPFDWGVAAVDAITNISSIMGMGMFGIGGVISGFRLKGFTGAIVGGLSGFATGYVAAYAVAAAGASIIGLPVIIPALAVGGVVSTFGGKFIVNAIFSNSIGEKNIPIIRRHLQESVIAALEQVQAEQVLEKWLKQSTNSAYTYVVGKLEEDVKNILTDFEHTMSQIRLDAQKKQTEIDAIRGNLNEMNHQLETIAGIISPVKEKLAHALGA